MNILRLEHVREKAMVTTEKKNKIKLLPQFTTQITKLKEGEKKQERGRKRRRAYDSAIGLFLIVQFLLRHFYSLLQ